MRSQVASSCPLSTRRRNIRARLYTSLLGSWCTELCSIRPHQLGQLGTQYSLQSQRARSCPRHMPYILHQRDQEQSLPGRLDTDHGRRRQSLQRRYSYSKQPVDCLRLASYQPHVK